jgi:hypothetical protein
MEVMRAEACLLVELKEDGPLGAHGHHNVFHSCSEELQRVLHNRLQVSLRIWMAAEVYQQLRYAAKGDDHRQRPRACAYP